MKSVIFTTKNVVFTAILLLILGIALTLFLEYENKRFVESLGEADIVPKQNSDVITLKPVTVKEPRRKKPYRYDHGVNERPSREDTTAEEQTQSDTPLQEDAEEIREPTKSFSERVPTEAPKPSYTENKESSEDSPESQEMTQEDEEKLRAQLLLQQIGESQPDMVIPIEELLEKYPEIVSKLSGPPAGDARVYLHYTRDESESVREALRTLDE